VRAWFAGRLARTEEPSGRGRSDEDSPGARPPATRCRGSLDFADMQASLSLDAPVIEVVGVSARTAATLGRVFDIATVRDLVEHYPAQGPGKYRDAGAVVPLAEATVGEQITVVGALERWQVIPTRRPGVKLVKATVRDDAGDLVEAAFFNREFLPRQHPSGSRVAISGALERFRGQPQLKAPKIIALGDDHLDDADRIRATYPATEALASPRIAAAVASALDALPTFPDHLPDEVRDRHGLLDLDDAIRTIHRPRDLARVRPARDRLVYDELLTLQLGLQQRRRRLEAEAVGLAQPPRFDGLAHAFLERLPFAPTADQRKAMDEIGQDLGSATPMHRLLQGDVGTGKTLVGAWAMLCAVDAGRQAALLAPTEVLAEQHFRTLSRLLAPVGVNGVADPELWEAPPGADLFGGPRLELITGSTPKTKLRGILSELSVGKVQLVIGTHALLEDRVDIPELGMVVIDEQHRFGVEHRTRVRDKRSYKRSPDVIVLTATPIPRSLALTLYGDLDVTVLRSRPFELKITTTVLPSDSPRRDRLYAFMREEIARGRRAYVVCPLIEDSESLPVASALTVHQELSTSIFPDLSVGLVHGRLPAAERDDVMEAFRDGAVQILVATTVIEVGVDVPEATVMLIEDADRFGISQLHQLRGRLYRGLSEDHCVLFSREPDANPRLQALAASEDGFDLAEVDLRLRGEGSLFDTRQSGLPDLKLASLVRDGDWVARAREDARALIAVDPQLTAHPALRAEVVRRYGEERLAAMESG
jgi:ATP-dependent DNA helicase RecG